VSYLPIKNRNKKEREKEKCLNNKSRITLKKKNFMVAFLRKRRRQNFT